MIDCNWNETSKRIVADNLSRLRSRIAEVCREEERAPGEVTLVAVTKYVNPSIVAGLLELGVTDIGENRARRLGRVQDELGDRARDATWHMVGLLQRRKVRDLLPRIQVFHAIDRFSIVGELEKRLEPEERPTPLRVFLEVNVSGEESKAGIEPDRAEELLNRTSGVPGLRIEGLMTMAPLEGEARPVFARLRKLRNDLVNRTGLPLPHLSMGMSGDFTEALREGATHLRIGSALFEGLEGE